MDFDIEGCIPWAFIIGGGVGGVAFAHEGQPVWSTLSFAIGTLVMLSFALPYVILFLRNPTGDRMRPLLSIPDAYDMWGYVCRRRQTLLNHFAEEVVRNEYYGPWTDYRPTDTEVYDWYGEDVYRVAREVAMLRNHRYFDASETLALFAEAKVTDFDRMLAYLGERLEPDAALAAIRHDIPLEYAKSLSVRPPTGSHD